MARIFLSYSHDDEALASETQAVLFEHGHNVFVDHSIRAGEDWRDQLYEAMRKADCVVALVTRSSISSRWCFAELFAAGVLEKARLLLAERLPHPDYANLQHVFYSTRWENAVSELLGELARLDARGGQAWAHGRYLYPWLGAYQTADAGVFFGRRRATQQVVRKLDIARQSNRFVAVVGPSGAGKSSLVRAGVIPRIACDGNWCILGPFRPGNSATLALADALVRGGVDNSFLGRHASIGAADIESEVSALLTRRQISSPPEWMLVVIDQLEEVIQFDTEANRRFVALVRDLLENKASRLVFLATVQAEYIDRLDRGMRGARPFEEPYVLSSPIREELREIVVEPFARKSLLLAPDVVEALLDETGDGRALAQLTYTLAELANAAAPETEVTMANYRATGGIAKTVRDRGEAALADASRNYARRKVVALLVSLVAVNREGRIVRRSVPAVDFSEQERRALDCFVERHIVVLDNGRYEIAHESVFDALGPFGGEFTARLPDLSLLDELERDGQEYIRSTQHALLWRGTRLWQARRLSRGGFHLSRSALALVRAASRAAAVRFWFAMASVLGALIVMSHAAGPYLLTRRSERLVSASRAASQRGDEETAFLLAVEAVRATERAGARADQFSEATLQLLTSTETLGRPMVLRAHAPGEREREGVAFVGWTDQGVVSRGNDGQARFWDFDGNLVATREVGHLHGSVWSSPDGLRVASGSWNRLVVWDARTLNVLATEDALMQDWQVRWSDDSLTLVAAPTHGSIRVLRFGPTVTRIVLGPSQFTEEVLDFAVSPDGSQLLRATSRGHVLLQDIRRQDGVERIVDSGGVRCVQSRSDNTWVLGVDVRAGQADANDLSQMGLRGLPASPLPLTIPAASAQTLPQWSGSRCTIVSAGDGYLAHTDRSRETVYLSASPCIRCSSRLGGSLGMVQPNHRHLVTWQDRRLTIRDRSDPLRVVREWRTVSDINAASLSHDGRRVASAHVDGLVRVWETDEHTDEVRTDSLSVAERVVDWELSRDGRLVFVTTEVGVYEAELRAGAQLARILSCDPGGMRLRPGSAGNGAFAWRCGDQLQVRSVDGRGASVLEAGDAQSRFDRVEVGDSGRLVVSWGQQGLVSFVPSPTGWTRTALENGAFTGIRDVAVARLSRRAVVALEEDVVVLGWDDEGVISVLASELGPRSSRGVTEVELTDDGRHVIAWSLDAGIFTAEVGSDAELRRIERGPGFAGFSSDGEMIVACVAGQAYGYPVGRTASRVSLGDCGGRIDVVDGVVLSGSRLAAVGSREGEFELDGEARLMPDASGVVFRTRSGFRILSLRANDLIRGGCGVVASTLRSEWERYFPGEPFRQICDPTVP